MKTLAYVFLAQVLCSSVSASETPELCAKIAKAGSEVLPAFEEAGSFATVIRLFSDDRSHREAAAVLVGDLAERMKSFNESMDDILEICRYGG